MTKLFILCGLPGSGKSTFALNRKQGNINFFENEQIPNSKLINIVNRDMIRYKVCGNDVTKENLFARESLVRNIYFKEIRLSCFKYLETYCDATQIDVSSRRRILNYVNDLITTNKVSPYAIYFNTSIEECIERDKTRTGLSLVGEKEIRDMAARLVIPKVEEGFKEVYII